MEKQTGFAICYSFSYGIKLSLILLTHFDIMKL